jgi:hypothetical protein
VSSIVLTVCCVSVEPPRFCDQVVDERLEGADVVDPRVLEEVRVLRRGDGLDHHLRDLAVGDDGAPLVEDLADDRAVGADDLRRLRRLVVLQRRELGQVLAVVEDQPAEGSGAQQRQHEAGEGDLAQLAKPRQERLFRLPRRLLRLSGSGRIDRGGLGRRDGLLRAGGLVRRSFGALRR